MSDDLIGFVYHGRRGTVRVLEAGTTERECEERGDHIYTLKELGLLLVEIEKAKKEAA